jgi:hypothetical protein
MREWGEVKNIPVDTKLSLRSSPATIRQSEENLRLTNVGGSLFDEDGRSFAPIRPTSNIYVAIAFVNAA